MEEDFCNDTTDVIVLRFIGDAHMQQFRDFLFTIERQFLMLIWCSILIFWSSAPWKTEHESQIDSLIATINVVLLDVTSSTFVVLGALTALLYEILHRDQVILYERTNHVTFTMDLKNKDWQSLLSRVVVMWRVHGCGHIIWIDTAIDVFGGIVISMLLHVPCQVLYNDFKFTLNAKSLLYNAWVSMTALNGFDTNAHDGMHLSNFGAVVPCMMLWCLALAPNIFYNVDCVQKKLGHDGQRIYCICNVVGVVLVTLISKFQHEKNIAYISFNSFLYHILEFSIGINLYRIYMHDDVLLHMCARVVAILIDKLLLGLMCVWLLHIGHRTISNDGVTHNNCARMYFFDDCLSGWSLAPATGCVLGIILVLDSMETHSTRGSIARCREKMTSMLFACPACMLVRIATAVNFEKTSSHASEFLFAFISYGVLILWGLVYKDMRLNVRIFICKVLRLQDVPQHLRFACVNTASNSALTEIQDVDS